MIMVVYSEYLNSSLTLVRNNMNIWIIHYHWLEITYSANFDKRRLHGIIVQNNEMKLCSQHCYVLFSVFNCNWYFTVLQYGCFNWSKLPLVTLSLPSATKIASVRWQFNEMPSSDVIWVYYTLKKYAGTSIWVAVNNWTILFGKPSFEIYMLHIGCDWKDIDRSRCPRRQTFLRDQTWLCVYCWCQTPEGVVSPRGETTPEGVWHQQYTHTIMFDPDYNMMPQFFPQLPIFCS